MHPLLFAENGEKQVLLARMLPHAVISIKHKLLCHNVFDISGDNCSY